MFVQQQDQVLLIRKLRGLGAGNINGPGGHIEQGETPIQGAIRETQEELCITPLNVRPAAELFFHADDMPKIHAYVFTAEAFIGIPTATAEAIPLWTPIDQIPYDEMWQDDQYWLPSILQGDYLHGWFSFAGDTLLDYKIVLKPPNDADLLAATCRFPVNGTIID